MICQFTRRAVSAEEYAACTANFGKRLTAFNTAVKTLVADFQASRSTGPALVSRLMKEIARVARTADTLRLMRVAYTDVPSFGIPVSRYENFSNDPQIFQAMVDRGKGAFDQLAGVGQTLYGSQKKRFAELIRKIIGGEFGTGEALDAAHAELGALSVSYRHRLDLRRWPRGLTSDVATYQPADLDRIFSVQFRRTMAQEYGCDFSRGGAQLIPIVGSQTPHFFSRP